MTTTTTVTREDAEGFLRLTAHTNLTGMIGTPHAGRYTLHEALGELARCEGVFQVESLNGLHILKASDVNGQHRWYVKIETDDDLDPAYRAPRDPWSAR
jgi:hypothetical protein